MAKEHTMKKIILTLLMSVTLLIACVFSASAAGSTTSYNVVSGDSMWKIAVKYQIGVSEIINANPQISNPNLIYPGQKLTIPTLDSSVTSYEQTVVDLVNEIRVKNGLSKLKINWELSRVARYKSQNMADLSYFSHTSPTYGTPFQMIKSFGITYRTAGENIAKGYKSPQAVVDGWMNSSGHRANILNASFTQIGVGYTSDGNHWTLMFIG